MKIEQWMRAAAEEIWESSQIDISCKDDDVEEFAHIIAEHAEHVPFSVDLKTVPVAPEGAGADIVYTFPNANSPK